MPDPPFQSIIGVPFIELQTVDSTNNYALQQIKRASPDGIVKRKGRAMVANHDGVPHGLAIFAHQQISGKGQRGKKWESANGLNMALSIVIMPATLRISQQFWLSACVSLAVTDLFKKYAGHDTKIKWPNDLYWKDRKAGGILIESGVGSRESGVRRREAAVRNQDAGGGEWLWAIIGIGINVNQTSFPAELPNPVSLKQITGKDFNPVNLAKELCELLNHRFEELIQNGFGNIYTEYLSRLYKRNEKVKLKKGNRVFEAIIKGVSPEGKLVVQHVIEEEFDFGSIEWTL